MSAIIAALLAELSKVLIPMLIEWLKSLFEKQAKKLEASGNIVDVEDLVQASIDATPRARVFKRALLRRIKDHAFDLAHGKKLSKADKAELAALGAKAKGE